MALRFLAVHRTNLRLVADPDKVEWDCPICKGVRTGTLLHHLMDLDSAIVITDSHTHQQEDV